MERRNLSEQQTSEALQALVAGAEPAQVRPGAEQDILARAVPALARCCRWRAAVHVAACGCCSLQWRRGGGAGTARGPLLLHTLLPRGRPPSGLCRLSHLQRLHLPISLLPPRWLLSWCCCGPRARRQRRWRAWQRRCGCWACPSTPAATVSCGGRAAGRALATPQGCAALLPARLPQHEAAGLKLAGPKAAACSLVAAPQRPFGPRSLRLAPRPTSAGRCGLRLAGPEAHHRCADMTPACLCHSPPLPSSAGHCGHGRRRHRLGQHLDGRNRGGGGRGRQGRQARQPLGCARAPAGAAPPSSRGCSAAAAGARAAGRPAGDRVAQP